jgi:hypothetical protein
MLAKDRLVAATEHRLMESADTRLVTGQAVAVAEEPPTIREAVGFLES